MSDEETKTEGLATWAVVDLFGHTRLAGRVTEEKVAGIGMVRIDTPLKDGSFRTRYQHPNSIYGLIPVDETTARAQAAYGGDPEPVSPWTIERYLQEQTPQLTHDGGDDGNDATGD